MRGRGLLDPVLAALALLLAMGCVVVVLGDRTPAPSVPEASLRLSARHDALVREARAEAAAFLRVDHRRMPDLTARVLRGATGAFRREYAANRDQLARAVRSTRTVAVPRIRAVGVGRIAERRAEVLVAADARVRNRDTGGAVQRRVYRLRLVLVRSGGRWLTASLGYVT